MRIIGISTVVIGLMLPGCILAAELRLVPTEIPIRVGQPVGIILNVDTPSDSANAFELEMRFDSEKLTYGKAVDAAAVTSFWIQYPRGCGDDGVCLSGMVPGGFTGLNQELVTLYFIPRESGTTTLSVTAARLLAHDGKGTAIPVETTSLDVFVEEIVVTSGAAQDMVDIDPPEPFTLKVSQDSAVEDGAHVLIFSTKDKQSSVAAYYVKEYSLPLLKWLTPWTRAESPYLLTDQSLKSTIAVKAVDLYGNERTSYIMTEQGYMHQNILLGILLVVLAIMFGLYFNRNNEHEPAR